MSRGSASLELVAMAPIFALFILVSVQLVMLFRNHIGAIDSAAGEAKKIAAGWDGSRAGFERPCLEGLFGAGDNFVRIETSSAIGAGKWKKEIKAPEEVHIVKDPICTPW